MSDQIVAPDVSGKSLPELFDLRGRIAVVTGGSRGIGLASAGRLSEAGAHVVLADVAEERAAGAAARLRASGRSASHAALDVRSTDSVNACFGRIVAEHGAIDILVNNAGLLPGSLHIKDMDDATWDNVLNVNITGLLRCSRAAAPFLIASRFGGVIVNLSSTSAFRASSPGGGSYATSKHAVDGFNKALALELGPLGVRVNAVAPTLVASPGMRELFAATGDEALALANATAYGATLPLGRFAVEDDIARGVLFLASDMATLMAGSTLVIDAGALGAGK